MTECLNCGYEYFGKAKIVKSCSRCTKLFSDATAEKIIKDFLKGW
jgi:predicted Zn-ribbon and HTH transcriptional regulator